MSQQHPQEQQVQPELPRPGRIMLFIGWLLWVWRRIENTLFVLVLLFIALYFVLQSPWVQNWLIQKVTTTLSEELHTTITIGHIDLAFFDKLALEQVYIEDLKGDTLLYAGQLTAGLKDNFFSVLNNRLVFDDITLSNARCNLIRHEGDDDFNYQFLLDYFSGNGPKKPKKKTPFQVKIRNLRLNDVVFVQNDQVNGTKMAFSVPKATLQINNFDMPSKIADIESLVLVNFGVVYQESTKHPLPKRTSAAITTDTSTNRAPSVPFRFLVNHFILENGQVSVDRFRSSPSKSTPDNVIDFNHLQLNTIGLNADSVRFSSDMNFTARFLQLAAKEQSGFALQQLSVKKLVVDSNLTALYGLSLRTDRSNIGDTVLFKYKKISDFKHFNQDIYFEAHLQPGTLIHPYDLAYFQESFAKNAFFGKNKDLDISISGLIKGKVNRLDGRNIVAKIGNSTIASFDFDGEDLARGREAMRMEFDFKRLQTDAPTLQQLIPGFKLPKNLEQLGAVNYVGTYNLLFGVQHILQGDLKSNLGNGKIDLKLDLSGGLERATYSGKLDMHRFALGTVTGNKELGYTSFNVSIIPGSQGLTRSSIKANIKGRVDTFTYKGYHYKDLTMDGTISESLFEGDMRINDPNINFVFTGKVNLKDTTPVYLFNAKLLRLDLGKLNLVKENIVVSANMDNVRLTGANWADISGIAAIHDIEITQTLDDRTYHHKIDSIRFESNYQAQNFRHFALRSDFLSANIDGNFTLSKAPGNFLRLISKYYPTLSRQLQLPAYDSVEIKDLFRFGIFISNTKDLTKLIDTQLDTIKNVSIGGQVDGQNGISEMYADIPAINYAGKLFTNMIFNWRSERNKAFMKLNLPKIKLSNKYSISGINLTGKIKDDIADLELVSDDPGAGVRSVNFRGQLSVKDSLWQVRFSNSQFSLFNLKWTIEKDNYVRFRKGFIDIQNLALSNGLRRLILESLNDGRGLNLIASNFDLNFVNEILPTRGLTYRGTLSDFGVTVQDIFNLKGIEVGLATDTVFVNNKPYGRIDGTVSMADLQHPMEWNISSRDKAFSLTTTGGWLMGGNTVYPSLYTPDLKPNDLYATVVASKFPMNILQQFIPGISKTEGAFDLSTLVNGKINGSKTEIGLDGGGTILEGGFVIDYLNTPFYLKDQKITLTDSKIWVDKDTIYDATRKNMAFVSGGLRHNLFKKWQIDCTVRSPSNKFVLMDTKNINNPTYYGKGVGSFEAIFGGTFSRTNIKIDATTGPNTKLYIPLTAETEAKEANFIKFKSQNKEEPSLITTTTTIKQKRFSTTDLKGLEIEMNLNLTEQAEVQLIFDEQAGDIISGYGNGDITIQINRDGEFKMYGNYTIVRGSYLFTLFNLVNKPFTVSPGGTIAWYGDPYNAQIEINANYRENTPLTNLIRDELAIASSATNLASEAAKSSPVNVNMRLSGDLFKPNIAFSFDFPNVSPQIKSYVDNKMRLLNQDPNETNRQVFGLILFGSFLPPDNFVPQTVGEGFSTFTQFISNQLSNYASSLANELLGGSVSSFDIDINYQNNGLQNLNTGTVAGRDLKIRMRSGFFDERVSIQVGSQFGVGNNPNPAIPYNNGFQGEDVVVEIQPMANRQWKIRIYQRTEPGDISNNEGFRNSFGMGLTFSKDFDNYSEMMSGIKKWAKKRNETGKQ